MEGNYEIKAFKKRAEEPQGNVTELFKADASQIAKIKETVANNFDSAIDTLNKALASVDGITNVPVQDPEGVTETTTSQEVTTEAASSEISDSDSDDKEAA